MKYNKNADKYLQGFYDSVGAKTWKQKYNALCLEMKIDPLNQSFSHNPTWKQKTGAVEYEFLEELGLIKLTLA